MGIFLVAVLAVMFSPAVGPAEELKIGLIPEQNVFQQAKRYQPLGAYLTQQTGHPVSFSILPRYGNIVDNFTQEKMDGAFWGSFTGALAIKKLGIQPLARPVWPDETSTYHGCIFVRKDSGISGVADMRGKVMALVDRATTAGYLFPLAFLRRHGVEDFSSYLGETFFVGSHDAAIRAVLSGEADIGCAKNTIYRLLEARDPRVARDLTVVARSAPVPSNGLAVRADLAQDTKVALRRVLLQMADRPEGREVLAAFGALRFIETNTEDYAPVFDFAVQAGVDLSTYRYVNE